MGINRGKCEAWIDMLFAILKMSKKLNETERKYIKGCFLTAFGNLELQEIKKRKEV